MVKVVGGIHIQEVNGWIYCTCTYILHVLDGFWLTYLIGLYLDFQGKIRVILMAYHNDFELNSKSFDVHKKYSTVQECNTISQDISGKQVRQS